MGVEENHIKNRINNLISWIRKQVEQAGKKGAVFGLSGGIDSALIAVLCQKAFPDNTMALILPCESAVSDIQDAMKIVQQYHIHYRSIDLTSIYQQLLSVTQLDNHKVARANIKPRLRMIVLYYFAAILDYLVVGTGNKSEISIGYFTKYGDGGVDILPLGNTLKSEVKLMAKSLAVPESIIDKEPSAGLWEHQTDENEMGFSYAQLDRFLVTGKIDDESVKNRIMQMNLMSSHKRKTPPIPEFNSTE